MRSLSCLCFPVALAAATSLSSAQFTLIDDFNDGNYDGWSLVDPTGAGTADASGNALRFQSLVPLPGAAGFGTVLDVSTVDPAYSNGVYRSTVRIDNDFNTGGIAARFNINQGLNFYYAFLGLDALGGGLALASVTGQGATLLDGVLLPEFAVGETWNIEFGLIGEKLSLSAWPVGEAYPGVLVEHTDAAFPLGAVGLVGGVSITSPTPEVVDVTFDDFQYAVPAPASVAVLGLGLAAFRRRR